MRIFAVTCVTASEVYRLHNTKKEVMLSMVFENIKELAKANTNFRQVIYTGNHSQLVLMSLLAGEDIGEETHETSDQILFIVEGEGEAILNGQKSRIEKKSAIFVPSGVRHNIENTGQEEMKLYTLYAPSVHADGIIHKTKADATKEFEK